MDGARVLGVQEALWAYHSNSAEVQITRSEDNEWLVGNPDIESHFKLNPRMVRLGPDLAGLLLTEVAGFDHLTYSHQLFVRQSKKLLRPWAVEGVKSGAPMWTIASVADPDRDGRDEIMVIEASRVGLYTDAGTEEWTLSVLGWDAKRAKLIKIPPGKVKARAYAAIVGSYPTIAQAKKAQEKTSCAAPFGLYKSDAFPRLKKGLFILASLHLSKTMAQATLVRAEECGLKGYLKRAY